MYAEDWAEALPPLVQELEQERENERELVKEPVPRDPEVPTPSPSRVQEVAFVALHESVASPP